MNHKTKLTFKELQRFHKGRIILLSYSNNTKTLAFSPVDNVDNNLPCQCGHSVWNATNFGGLVHFCPDREMEVEVTDFKAVEFRE